MVPDYVILGSDVSRDTGLTLINTLMVPYIDDMSWYKGSQSSSLAARSSGGRDRVETCMVASEGRRGSVESQTSRCGFPSMF